MIMIYIFCLLVGKQLIVYTPWGWVMYQYWLGFDTFCPPLGGGELTSSLQSVGGNKADFKKRRRFFSCPSLPFTQGDLHRLNLTDFCLDFRGQLTITVGNDIILMMSADQRTPGLGRADQSLPAYSLYLFSKCSSKQFHQPKFQVQPCYRSNIRACRFHFQPQGITFPLFYTENTGLFFSDARTTLPFRGRLKINVFQEQRHKTMASACLS